MNFNQKGSVCRFCPIVATGTGTFDIPTLTFNYLKGRPAICEKCLALKLGIEDAEWEDVIKNFVILNPK